MAKPTENKVRNSISELENAFFDKHLAYSIIALANLISQNTSKNTLAGTALSVSEWRIMRMAFIYKSICAADIINLFGLDKTTTSRAISRLHKRKLVRLTVDAKDKRQTNVSLSAAGKRLHDKIIKRDKVSDESIEKILSRQELKTFHSAMRKLRTHVKEKMLENT